MQTNSNNATLILRNLVAGSNYITSEFNSTGNLVNDCKLTDGIYATTNHHDLAWESYKGGMTKAIVFDLGSNKSIRTIKANFLEDGLNDIEFPHTVSFYVSMNNKDWSNITHIGTLYNPFTNVPPRTQMYIWDGVDNGLTQYPHASEVYARYIKVTFTTNGLILADEIEIWGVDDETESSVQLTPDVVDYLKAGENTANIQNLMLLYNGWYKHGLGDWTREKIIPYISYINKDKNPQDWFFDGILYLGLWGPEDRSFEGYEKPTNKKDWIWYIEKTFKEQGDFSELNEAVKEISFILGHSERKYKVVFMIPYPSSLQDNFGDLNGDGIFESFCHETVDESTAFDNRKKAVNWYINEVLEKWKLANYSHLELCGLYWLHEGVEYAVPNEMELIQYASDLTHKNGLKFFWVPYFNANCDHAWREMGIDAVAKQPNHFFYETEASRIQDNALLAKQYGMGIEIEFDERINTDDKESHTKFINYLNGGVDFGYMKNAFRAYYQGNIAILEAALSNDSDVRKNYDMIYQFVKGTYQKH